MRASEQHARERRDLRTTPARAEGPANNTRASEGTCEQHPRERRDLRTTPARAEGPANNTRGNGRPGPPLTLPTPETLPSTGPLRTIRDEPGRSAGGADYVALTPSLFAHAAVIACAPPNSMLASGGPSEQRARANSVRASGGTCEQDPRERSARVTTDTADDGATEEKLDGPGRSSRRDGLHHAHAVVVRSRGGNRMRASEQHARERWGERTACARANHVRTRANSVRARANSVRTRANSVRTRANSVRASERHARERKETRTAWARKRGAQPTERPCRPCALPWQHPCPKGHHVPAG